MKKQILKAVVTLLCYCALEAVILANDNSMTMYEKAKKDEESKEDAKGA